MKKKTKRSTWKSRVRTVIKKNGKNYTQATYLWRNLSAQPDSMNLNFISQYLLARKGTMVPKRFHLWSAISLLNASLGVRVMFDEGGHFVVRPTIFICLVGDPATKKTVAKDEAKRMWCEVFPHLPVGPSITTREDIVNRLCKSEAERSTIDHQGKDIVYKPLNFYINELSNFLSHNPAGMIDFLTDIYDTNYFDSSTLKHGAQPIENPCLNILACTVPMYVIEKLKLNVIGGGFSRRMLFVYETELPQVITFPHKSPESFEAEEWCRKHLAKISKLHGVVKWTDEAKELFNDWNVKRDRRSDPVLTGYYSVKDITARKIMLALMASKIEPDWLVTPQIMRDSLAILADNEINLPRLTAAAGKNDEAVVVMNLLDRLTKAGGVMKETDFRVAGNQDVPDFRYMQIKKFLKETGQIEEVAIDMGGVKQACIINKEFAKNIIKINPPTEEKQ